VQNLQTIRCVWRHALRNTVYCILWWDTARMFFIVCFTARAVSISGLRTLAWNSPSIITLYV